MRALRTQDDGFTLLEVMYVVLVLGILVSIAIASHSVSTDRSLRVACHENIRILDTAVVMYQQQHGDPPESLAAISSQVAGRKAYATCPAGDLPYAYNSITGQITCANHLLLP